MGPDGRVLVAGESATRTLTAPINQKEREESWTRGRKPESWACSGLGFGVSTPVLWLPSGEMESDSALS